MTTNPGRETIRSSPGRRIGAAAMIGLVAAILAAGLGATALFGSFENTTYDLRVRWTAVPARPASPIALVEIDDATIRALEPVAGRFPWPRLVEASALDYLTQSGAKVVAFDLLFGEREGRSDTTINGRVVSGDESDRAFVESVRRARNVVLLVDATSDGLASGPASAAPLPDVVGPAYAPGAGFQVRPVLSPPFDDLAHAAIGLGHNVFVRDPGSDSTRRMLPFIAGASGATVPSLGVAAALAFLGATSDEVRLEGSALRIRDRRLPLEAESVPGTGATSRQALVHFVRPVPDRNGVSAVFPTYSFFDVVLSEDQATSGKPPAIPASAFRDKLVFVGTSAAGTFDRFSTPFDGGAAGVEFHAMLADNILSGAFMRRAGPGVDRALVAGMAMLSAFATTCLPVLGGLLAVAGLIGGEWAWVQHEVARGVWVAAVAPATAAALGAFGGVAWQYLVEGREKRHIKRLFGRYVSKDVIEQLIADPSRASLGGERRLMTVLFSDIRNFTTATEHGTPEGIVAQLNEYFGEMVGVLFRHEGTLDKFVGDMVMGLFGAPLPDPRHADHAVLAALDMLERLAALNRRWAAEGRPAIDIGIGINTGEMIVGNIGAEAAMSYTVIGDAVNLGSRLESLNKQYGTHVLISESTKQALTIAADLRPIGAVTVKGRHQPVMVYELRGAARRAGVPAGPHDGGPARSTDGEKPRS